MRITKKFAGASCIGKQVFQPSEDLREVSTQSAEYELRHLERQFLTRLGSKGSSAGYGESSSRRRASASNFGKSYAYDVDDDDGEEYEDNGDEENDGDVEDAEDDAYPATTTSSSSHLRQTDRNESFQHTRGHTGWGSRASLVQRPRRVVSAPDLASIGLSRGGSKTNFYAAPSTAATGSLAKRRRSQSVMGLMDFEKYCSDDVAAGTLFFLFVFVV